MSLIIDAPRKAMTHTHQQHRGSKNNNLLCSALTSPASLPSKHSKQLIRAHIRVHTSQLHTQKQYYGFPSSNVTQKQPTCTITHRPWLLRSHDGAADHLDLLLFSLRTSCICDLGRHFAVIFLCCFLLCCRFQLSHFCCWRKLLWLGCQWVPALERHEIRRTAGVCVTCLMRRRQASLFLLSFTRTRDQGSKSMQLCWLT